jgi:hypothetical protein
LSTLRLEEEIPEPLPPGPVVLFRLKRLEPDLIIIYFPQAAELALLAAAIVVGVKDMNDVSQAAFLEYHARFPAGKDI